MNLLACAALVVGGVVLLYLLVEAVGYVLFNRELKGGSRWKRE